MIKVISISTDRNIFKEGSPVRQRQAEYGTLFEELHIIVFASQSFVRSGSIPTKVQIGQNVWAYPTNSFSKFSFIKHAVAIAAGIVRDKKCTPENTVVTVQNPFETGLVGLRLKKRFGLPLHVQMHTDFLSPYFKKESFSNRMRILFAKKIIRKADGLRVVSSRIAESLAPLLKHRKLVPQVLPIFVDIEKITEATVRPDLDLQKKYPQFNFIILMASRLTKEKNISFAIGVLSRLLDEYPKLGLVIVGSGPEKRALQQYAKKLNVEANVVFEDWQGDLVPYYKTAHMFLVTSDYEGFGMTIIEATAAHCPTVSTDVGIASKILKDGTSFVCPVNDVACFYNNISRLIENNDIREQFAHEAFDRLDSVAITDHQKYLSLYKENIENTRHA